MVKKWMTLLLLCNCMADCQSLGLFFSLGPGFNSGRMQEWIDSYQMGSNFGIEFEIKNFILKFGFNPETSEGKGTNESIIINETTWPNGLQINFMAYQYLFGYQYDFGKYHIIPFVGMSQSWLTVPYKYEDSFIPGEGKPDNRKYVTEYSYGPMIQITNRYNILKYELLQNIMINVFANIDFGYIKPFFDKCIDRKLTGDHFIFKIGLFGCISK